MIAAPARGLHSVEELSGRYLTFYLDDVLYGIELLHVTEIISPLPVTPVPGLPAHLKGIINLRGKMIPVFDMRARFGLSPREWDDKTCFVVAAVQSVQVGLIVDRVSDVLAPDREQPSPPPGLGGPVSGDYLRSVSMSGDRVILNLDCEKLFAADLLA